MRKRVNIIKFIQSEKLTWINVTAMAKETGISYQRLQKGLPMNREEWALCVRWIRTIMDDMQARGDVFPFRGRVNVSFFASMCGHSANHFGPNRITQPVLEDRRRIQKYLTQKKKYFTRLVKMDTRIGFEIIDDRNCHKETDAQA